MADAPLIVPSNEELCLDFANTLAWRGRAAPVEALSTVADLLNWLETAAGLPPLLVEPARKWSRDEPGEAATLFAEAIALREAIYRILAASASGAAAAAADFGLLNDALVRTPPRTRLVRRAAGYAWAAEPAGFTVAALLAPVSWSAADLLTRIDRYRVRRCANDECLWLFIDHSKGGARRWCDMKSCGNRAKSQRHYLKSRSAAKGRSA